MYFSRLFLTTVSFSAIANAVILKSKRDSTLEVTLTPTNQCAEIAATVKNIGTQDLNLLKLGTFLDSAPIQKLVVVDESNAEVQFTGIRANFQYSSLAAQNFQLLQAGATITITINAASVHEFKTGRYSFTAEGTIPFAVGGSTTLSGSPATFRSNTITLSIDEEEAALVENAIPSVAVSERAILQPGCSSDRYHATTNAFSNCQKLALEVVADASNTSSTKFVEYFKTNSSSARSTVVARLNAVANECSSSTSGITKVHCIDIYGYCTWYNLIAYTIPVNSYVILCPLFYDNYPPLPITCHQQDQATTMLHEMTHAPDVFTPGTSDYAYGYDNVTELTDEYALLNADSYSLYANAIFLGC